MIITCMPISDTLYRWVEPRKALSNLRSNSLYPGRWHHLIPGVGRCKGISFGFNEDMWAGGTEDAGLCFAIDGDRLKAGNLVQFPAQDIYNLTTAVDHPLSDGSGADDYRIEAIRPSNPPTEAFYVGVLKPLSEIATEIILQHRAPCRLVTAAALFADAHNIPLRHIPVRSALSRL